MTDATNPKTVLSEHDLCSAIDAIATWQQSAAGSDEVPIPHYIQDAMEAVRKSHEEIRSLLDEVREVIRKMVKCDVCGSCCDDECRDRIGRVAKVTRA